MKFTNVFVKNELRRMTLNQI